MRPVLFHIGSLPVHSYIVFVNIGFLACLAYGLIEGKRQGLNPVHVIDSSLVIFVFGILGARLLFAIVEYERFLCAPLDVLKIWKGGLVYYGGLAGAAAGMAGYLRWRREPLAAWADFLAPVAMISLGFGRIGCFLNGCCYGRIAPDLPWGVVYPHSHTALGLYEIKVHPSPIYECIAAFIILAILIALLHRGHKPGEVFWLMVILYAAARFGLEIFRGDPRGFVVEPWLSTSQAISLIAAAAAVWFHHRVRVRPGETP